MSTVRVMYIGLKPMEIDNKKGKSGVIWRGHGDIQDVPAWAWPALSKHPDVWVDVPGEPSEAAAGLSAVAPPPVKQEVDDDDLLALRNVIAPAEQAEPVAPVEQAINLYTLNTAALREYAAAKGYDVGSGLRGQALRTAIMSAGG